MTTISPVGSPVGATTSTTLGVAPKTLGDLMVVTIQTSDSTTTATGLSGGGVTTWHRSVARAPGTEYGTAEIWWGQVTATGSSTITVTGVTPTTITAQEFTTGTSVGWAVDGPTTSGYGSCSPQDEVTVGALTPSGSGGDLYVCLFMNLALESSGFKSYEAVDVPVVYLSTASKAEPVFENPEALGHSALPYVYVACLFELTATPSVPSLVSPANGGTANASEGVQFQATYNVSGSDDLTAYSMRIKVSGGAYNYWNAATAALQSTQVWNSETASPGTVFGPFVQAGVLTNGDTYNWSLAAEDANGVGPFASDATFTAVSAPSVSVTGPTGTLYSSDAPFVTWTASFAAGDSQQSYSVIVESGTYGTSPGSGTQVYSSGTVAGTGVSQQVTPLANGTYRAFVQITDIDSVTSAWAFTTFTVSVDTPNVPVVTSVMQSDPVTGLPEVLLSVQCQDNMLTSGDSNAVSPWTWTPTANTTLSTTTSESLYGSSSFALTAEAAGSVGMTTATDTYPVAPSQTVTAVASLYAPSTARPAYLTLTWYDAFGDLLSTVSSTPTDDAVSSWTEFSLTAESPPTAAFVTLGLVIESLAESEVHYADCLGIFPGTGPTWALGGYVGNQQITISRSDGQLVRGAGWDGTASPIVPSQNLQILDAEIVPGDTYCYVATVTANPTGVAGESVTSPASSPSASVIVPTQQLMWLFDPTNLSSAVGFAVNGNWSPIVHEVGALYYPLGNPTAVKSSDGSKGYGGILPAVAWSVEQDAAVAALMQASQPLYLMAPGGQGGWWITWDPATDRKGGHKFSTMSWAPLNEWQMPTYVECGRP